MTKGYFTFVLHSHLPYVISHGRWPHGMDWLNEAAAETYIPILNILNELLEEGLSPKLTLSITPVLAEQLADEQFITGFQEYLDLKIKTAQDDRKYFHADGEKQMETTATFWLEYYTNIKKDFTGKYDTHLIAAFRKLLDQGVLDIITCGATHGYFPLLSQDASIEAQVKCAITSHERHFGRKPRGIWLPECAYRPRYKWIPPVSSTSAGDKPYPRKGVDEILSENHLEYFIIDSHLLKGGKAIGVYIDRFEGLKLLWKQFEKEIKERPEELEKSPYDLYMVSSNLDEPKKPVAVFTRDPKTGLQVWSGEHGYPGDGWYLDFHKKRWPGGLRYWRVTSAKADLGEKMEYYPQTARERVPENAWHFTDLIKNTLKEHFERTKTPGILTAPFDSELFGHWWFEGPQFLKEVLRRMCKDPEIELTNCSSAIDAMDHEHPHRVISIPEGSWGEGGYHYIWFNENTEWTWKHIYNDEVKMKELVGKHLVDADQTLTDVLKQCARELLLLQSSDWQFLISTIAAKDYAEVRLTNHHSDFTRLTRIAEDYTNTKQITPEDKTFLKECNERDSLFPDLELDWWN